jgi:TldD protein
MIDQDLSRYRDLFQDYTELRAQETRSHNIFFVNGNLMGNNRQATGGISARVYRAGSWGFASSPGQDDAAVKQVLSEAGRNAGFLDGKLRKARPPLPAAAARVEKSHATSKPRLTPEELVRFAAAIDVHIASTYKDVISRKVLIQNLDIEKSLVTASGAVCHTMIPRSLIVIVLTADKAGSPVELLDIFGGLGQFEDVFSRPEELFPAVKTIHENLRKKCEGELPTAGVAECVLDSRLAGILAHEAVGHTTEADLVLGGSVAADNLNKEVASPLINLVDFAHRALGKTCPIPVYADDEGTEANDAVIIDRGVLKRYMHNKESALLLGDAPTGNARAWAFSDEPLIRMRNTAFLPGKDSLAAMIESVADGYYLCDTSNGQADSTGEFTFGVTRGYRIKNGKLGKAILDTTISGVAFEMLKTVTMVSDEMHWMCGGFCGKKQLMTVGMGGPAIKCRVMIGGR